MPIFSAAQGLALFGIFAVIMLAMTTWLTQKITSSKEGYLLADRSVSSWQGAVSISSAWIWAGAIFLSSEVAYKWGWPGLFYFSFMNILTLFLFAPFAQRIRNLAPQGFTWSSYLKDHFGARVQGMYLVLFVLFVICVLTFNIFAASTLINTLTGIDFAVASIVVTVLALLYNLRKGLAATIVTETFKLIVVALAAVISVGALFVYTNGWSTLISGINGVSQQYTSLWGKPEAWTLFITYGLITMLGHLANPWADNSFHQRAFAVPKPKVFQTFALATMLFAGIPLLIGSIGFFAVGSNIRVEGAQQQMINVLTLSQLLPGWIVLLFVFAAFAAMVSIADSQLTSLSSLLGHDLHEKFGGQTNTVSFSRWGQIIAAGVVIGLVNVPGFTLLYLIMIIAMVRITTLFPSMLALTCARWVSSRGLFWGMLTGAVIGIPLYAWGAYFKQQHMALTGFFITLILAPLCVLAISFVDRFKR